MNIHESMRIYTNIHEYARLFTKSHKHTRIHTNIHEYTLICMNIHEYTRTDTHTHTNIALSKCGAACSKENMRTTQFTILWICYYKVASSNPVRTALIPFCMRTFSCAFVAEDSRSTVCQLAAVREVAGPNVSARVHTPSPCCV